MVQTVQVFVADPQRRFCEGLRQELSRDPEIRLVGWSQQWSELSQALETCEYQWVLYGFCLGDREAFQGLTKLRRILLTRGSRAKIFLVGDVGDYVDEQILNYLDYVGCSSCFTDPKHAALVLEYFKRTLHGEQSQQGWTVPPASGATWKQTFSLAAEQELDRLCFRKTDKGYVCLCAALVAIQEDPTLLDGVTKVLYPLLGQEFQVQPWCIERNMRYSIARARRRCSQEVWSAYFGEEIQGKKPDAAMSNKRFLRLLYEGHLQQGCWRAASDSAKRESSKYIMGQEND